MEQLTDRAISSFCQELAVLIHAGIPTADAADVMSDDPVDVPAELLSGMAASLAGGQPLSDAISATGAFPAHVSAMVRMGERSGRLEECLSALSRYYRQKAMLAEQARRSLAYPAAMLLMVVAALAVLVMKILPVFGEVYASMGAELGGFAGGLLSAGTWLRKILPGVMVGLCAVLATALVVLLVPRMRGDALKTWQSRGYRKGPLRKMADARIAQSLAMCLSSGVPLEEALALTGDAVDGMGDARERCSDCAHALTSGSGIRDALSSSKLLPPRQARLFALAWDDGMDTAVMDGIADELTDQAVQGLERAMGSVEPAIVACASALIAAVLVSVMLPILSVLASLE